MDFLDRFQKSSHTLSNENFFQFVEFLFLNLAAYLALFDPTAATPNLKEFILHSWLGPYIKTNPLIITRPVLGKEVDESQMTWVHIYARGCLVILCAAFPGARLCSRRFMARMGLDFDALIKVLHDTTCINFEKKDNGEKKTNVVYLIFKNLKDKQQKEKEQKNQQSHDKMSSLNNYLPRISSVEKSSKNVTNFLNGRNVFTALVCETATYLILGSFIFGYFNAYLGFICTPEQAEKLYPKTMYAKVFNQEVKFYSIIEVYFYWSMILKYALPLINLALILAIIVAISDLLTIFILRFFLTNRYLTSSVLSYWATINIESGILFEMCDANKIYNTENMVKYFEDKLLEKEGEQSEYSEYQQSSSDLFSKTLKTVASSGRYEKNSSSLRI